MPDGTTYRTINVNATYPEGNVTGYNAVADCQFDAGNSLSYNGRTANQAWLGHAAGDGSGYRAPPWSQICGAPIVGGMVNVTNCTAPDGSHSVAQDDASLVIFPNHNFFAHCSGVSFLGFCPPDIYTNGVGNAPGTISNPAVTRSSNAWRGAGFMNYGTQNYTALFSPNAQGLTTTPIRLQIWNTWPSGYGVNFIMTFRYPPPPAAVAQCISASPVGAIVAGQPFTYQVRVQNTGGVTWDSNFRLGSAHHSTNNYLTNGPPDTPEDRIYLSSTSPLVSSVPPGATVTFSFTRTAPAAPGSYPYEWRIMQDGPFGWFGPRCGSNIIVAAPAATATCSIVPPGSFEVGETFDVQVSVRNTSPSGSPSISSSDGQLVISSTPGLSGISPPPGMNLAYGPVAPSDDQLITITGVYSNTPGVYNIQAKLQIPSDPPPCSTPVSIGLKSYLKTFGGEVMTGGAVGSGSCTPDSGRGGIHAWTGQRGSDYVGASAQLTVSSLLTINEFYSASNRPANQPKGLTIANTGSATYGGARGDGRCLTDYYNDTRDASINRGNWTGSISAGRGQYFASGGTTNINGLTVPVGSQAAIYVEGDVMVRNNIVYSAAGSWAQSPYLVIIAQGDIRIAGNVTRLDGLYISQGGTIYTCAQSPGNLYDASNVFDNCRNQLVVNGGLVSNDIRFLRMNGTLRDAVVGESIANGGNIAEIINYTPEMYLAPSPLRRPASSAGSGAINPNAVGAYQSIKSLPPIY